MQSKNVQMPKTVLFILILVIAALSLANVMQSYLRTENSRVTRVIDGDSFETRDGKRVRLLSLDAPEKDRCLYFEAREKLKSLIQNKKIILKDKVTDDYGRILANVFEGDNFINKIMLQEGLARFTYTKSPYYDDLKNIYINIKKLKIGVYSPLCRTTSTAENCQIKANNNHGKKIYFTPSCRNYDQVIVDEAFGDRWFCSEADAINSGFNKATACN